MRNKTFLKTVAWITLVAMVNACSVYRIKSVEKMDEIRKGLALTADNTLLYVHVDGEIKELINIERNGHEISGDLVAPEAEELSVYLDGKTKGIEHKVTEKNIGHYHSSKAAMGSSTMKEVERIVENNKTLNLKNQFHFFLRDVSATENGHVQFEDSKITKMEIIEKTISVDGNQVLRVILTVVLTLVILLILVFAVLIVISCNCPRIYLNNGTQWSYNNSLFAGATNPALERTDFKKLDDFSPNNDELTIEIRNEEAEIQHINELRLWVVTHNEDEHIVNDQQGNYYRIKNAVAPTKVLDAAQNDQTSMLNRADDKAYSFDLLSEREHQSLTGQFDGLDGNKDSRLILRVKNSDWAGYVNESFKKAMGSTMDNWLAKNAQKSKAELDQAFEDKGVALTIAVKQGKQWKKLENVAMVGNVAYQEIAIPVSKELIKHGSLNIQISAGFKLWSLDQISIDQSNAEPLNATLINPTSMQQENNDVSASLLEKDVAYTTLTQGEHLTLEFNGLPLIAGMKRSLFLQGSGYYLPALFTDYKPQWAAIYTLQQPFGISKYAFNLYLDQYGMK